MTTTIWWVGPGDRSLTTQDWQKVGITADTITWSAVNGWSVLQALFTNQQIQLLRTLPNFMLDQSGPRLSQSPVTRRDTEGSGYFYYSQMKNLYDQLVDESVSPELMQAAKNPDVMVTGSVTVDSNDLVVNAAVVWPDGTPGTLTITARDANSAVMAYNITYGSPVTKTYAQPAITRNANGAATFVPAIVVS